MLRIYFLQRSFNLSDPGAEETLYDSALMRISAGIELGQELIPDEIAILNFRAALPQCVSANLLILHNS